MSSKSCTFAAKNAMEKDRFLRKAFLEMLIACDCKQLFLENMCEQLKDVATWEFLFKMPEDKWVKSSFLWSETEQGFKYWERIDWLWHLIISAYRTNTNDQ